MDIVERTFQPFRVIFFVLPDFEKFIIPRLICDPIIVKSAFSLSLARAFVHRVAEKLIDSPSCRKITGKGFRSLVPFNLVEMKVSPETFSRLIFACDLSCSRNNSANLNNFRSFRGIVAKHCFRVTVSGIKKRKNTINSFLYKSTSIYKVRDVHRLLLILYSCLLETIKRPLYIYPRYLLSYVSPSIFTQCS